MTIETYEIVGTVLTIVMAVNGFFLKNVYSDMQFIKIELAKLLTNHENIKDDVVDNRNDIADMKKRIHKLEGAYGQFEYYLKEVDKK